MAVFSSTMMRKMIATKPFFIFSLWLLFSIYIIPLDATSHSDSGERLIRLLEEERRKESWQRRRQQNARRTQQQQQGTTVGNCVAGGSGYGLYFDYNRADVVSLRWTDIPKETITVEFWFRNTDPFLPDISLFAYSVHNINGYQNGGGEVYEAPNELSLRVSPHRWNLWRGGESEVELVNEVNPKVGESFSDGEWHHYAFSVDSRDGGSAVFYLDGKQLDFGTTIVEGVDSYQKATYSNDWDVAESHDALDYYGDFQTSVVYIENPCQEDSYTDFSPGAEVTALLKRSDQCEDVDQAGLAASKGARFVVIQLDESTPDENLVLTTDAQSKLSVPVISVSYGTGEELRESGTIRFIRIRETLDIGEEFGKLIEPDGVLTLGQEPDAPWGDFDPFQAANGVFDELRVWDVSRSAEQIQSNYRTSIDVENDPDAAHLNLYYTFDAAEDMTVHDSSPLGVNDGLVGALPTIKNQMTYANGDMPRIPTRPDWIPTSSSPLVGTGDVVVPVVPGGDTFVELKSFDPDGDDLITLIISEPSQGSIHSVEENIELSMGDTVADRDRTENKRVLFRAPSDFISPVTFQYSVSDGGVPVNATVRLVLHAVVDPSPKTETIEEDTLTFFSLAMPSQLTQTNMLVVVTTLPERGTLFEPMFSPGKDRVYTSLPTQVDQFGPMDAIEQVGTTVSNSRGVLMYIPEENAFSDPAGSVYETFGYRFIDPESGLEGAEAFLSIIVEAENDSPLFDESNTEKSHNLKTTESLTVELASLDVDADSSFGERAFARVTQFPKAGLLYQFNESISNNKGGLIDPVIAVPTVFAWASKVLRFSSQYSQCGKACYSWNNPACPKDCTQTGWAASQILGEPDVYPTYASSTLGWTLGEKNFGHEFIELEFPFDMYISGLELYEVYKPGAVWTISTTESYVDDVSVHCTKAGDPDIPECSHDSEWITLWSKPQESVTLGSEGATVFTPPLCPSIIRTNTVRIDLDTARAPGWNTFDAVKLIGSLEPPPGLVEDSQNRLMYAPRLGVHGNDYFSFAFSDCLSEGTASTLPVSIERPPEGEFSSSVLYEEDIFLLAKPNEVIEQDIDFTKAIESIALILEDDPGDLVGSVWHTDALGAASGEIFPNTISRSNPVVSLDLGVDHSGSAHQHRMEVWLASTSPENNLTFRVRYRLLSCDNGNVVNELAINGKNVCVVEDENLIPTGLLAFGYTAVAISWFLALFFLGWIFRYRNDSLVKVSQIEFLVLICVGAMISSSTIVALSFQAGSDEDTTAASRGCSAAPFLYTIGWVLMYSSLTAKTFRLYKVMHSQKQGEAETVTFWSTFQIVLFALSVDMAIVIAWTITNPLVYEREEIGRDIDVENGLITIQSIGQCMVRDEQPSVWAFVGPLIGFHLVLLAAAAFLLLKVRGLKGRYQESKYVAMAMMLMLEIIVVGVPLLAALKDSVAADYGVMVAIVALHDIGILCFIFVPKVLFQMKGPGGDDDNVESIILASFQKTSNSRWDEGLAIVNKLLTPGSDTRKAMTAKEAESLQDVKTLLVQGIQGSRDSNAMHIPAGLVKSRQKHKLEDHLRFVLREFGGLNVTGNQSLQSRAESSLVEADFERDESSHWLDEDTYILPEFQELNQRKGLIKLLSWSSLKQWNFNAFDVDELTGGHALLFISWAILGAPHAQYSMAVACGHTDRDIDDFKGYHFVGPKTTSGLGIPMKKLCDYLRVIENDYIAENPYHNAIHASDVLQTVHSFLQMKCDIIQTTDEDLFAILLAAVVHDVNHPGKNNAFQVNARTSLAMVYNDASVLENRHASHAFMRMLGMDEGSENFTDDLNILHKISKQRFSSIRSKVVGAILKTDMSEHFRFVNMIKGLCMSIQEGQNLTPDDHWNILQYILHVADISNPAKEHPLCEIWAHRCISEFFAQGDKEAEIGLPVSPNCDRRTTKLPESQIGFITYVVRPTFEVLGMIIPEVQERILPVINKNMQFWEQQKAEKAELKEFQPEQAVKKV